MIGRLESISLICCVLRSLRACKGHGKSEQAGHCAKSGTSCRTCRLVFDRPRRKRPTRMTSASSRSEPSLASCCPSCASVQDPSQVRSLSMCPRLALTVASVTFDSGGSDGSAVSLSGGPVTRLGGGAGAAPSPGSFSSLLRAGLSRRLRLLVAPESVPLPVLLRRSQLFNLTALEVRRKLRL